MKFNKKVLKNGLRVITVPMNNTKAVTLMVLVRTGARDESEKNSGISHFLEHLFFKGSKKYSKPREVSKMLDRIGARHNAYTGREDTGFWVKSASADFDLILGILSDMILNPLFNPKELERERGVILQEISMYKDDYPWIASNNLKKLMYGNLSIGKDILGSVESVKQISRDDILKYKKNRYLSENMVVVVAGDIDESDAFAKIEKLFSKAKSGKVKPITSFKNNQKNIEVNIEERKIDQSHIAIGIKAFSMFDKRQFVLELLSVILGGNSSSKLFTEIREKSGLAYYVGSGVPLYQDVGYLRIGAGVPKSKLLDVFNKIANIIYQIREKGVSKGDLYFAKEYVRGRKAISFENSSDIADFYGDQELFYGKVLTPGEVMEKFEKVTTDDIMKVAKDIFKVKNINISGVVPQDGDPVNIDKIKSIFCDKLK